MRNTKLKKTYAILVYEHVHILWPYTPFPIAIRHTLQLLKAELFSWESCHTYITTRHTVIKTELFSWESCLGAKSCKQCIKKPK